MYGLVNKGLKQFVITEFGEQAWARVHARADDRREVFVNMQAYDDDVTYGLVGAATQELGVEVAELLERFGEYWILYTAEEGYGSLLQLGGSDLREFLSNLDELHARVAMSFTELRPPSFELVEVEAKVAELHYHSERPGLSPMMIGLLTGLSKRFDEAITVEQTAAKDEGAEHDVFRVTWR